MGKIQFYAKNTPTHTLSPEEILIMPRNKMKNYWSSSKSIKKKITKRWRIFLAGATHKSEPESSLLSRFLISSELLDMFSKISYENVKKIYVHIVKSWWNINETTDRAAVIRPPIVIAHIDCISAPNRPTQSRSPKCASCFVVQSIHSIGKA